MLNRITLGPEKRQRVGTNGEDLLLDFMLRALRGEPVQFIVGEGKTENYDPTFEDRKWVAQQAGPYLHPPLNAVDATADVNVRHEHAPDELE